MAKDFEGAVEGGILTVLGAYIVNEVVTAMSYTGTGSGLVDLLPFFVIVVGVLIMVSKALS